MAEAKDNKPKVDPYPKPVALTALNLRKLNKLQSEKGRNERLKRLARRNRDVAWLMAEFAKATAAKLKKAK